MAATLHSTLPNYLTYCCKVKLGLLSGAELANWLAQEGIHSRGTRSLFSDMIGCSWGNECRVGLLCTYGNGIDNVCVLLETSVLLENR